MDYPSTEWDLRLAVAEHSIRKTARLILGHQHVDIIHGAVCDRYLPRSISGLSGRLPFDVSNIDAFGRPRKRSLTEKFLGGS